MRWTFPLEPSIKITEKTPRPTSGSSGILDDAHGGRCGGRRANGRQRFWLAGQRLHVRTDDMAFCGPELGDDMGIWRADHCLATDAGGPALLIRVRNVAAMILERFTQLSSRHLSAIRRAFGGIVSDNFSGMSIDYLKLAAACRVEPGTTVDLERNFDPGRADHRLGKQGAEIALEQAKQDLFALQDKFYAQADHALLLVLQAIDAAGKDGTIKHVMSGVNPEGVDVHSFKAPSTQERSHDYLWRHQLVVPELGRIAVFNRSHYENVTVTRVHPELLWPRSADLTSKHVWRRRYRQINDWERYLSENGTVIIKIFLYLSRAEQKKRFLERIDDKDKNWKVSAADMKEREYWDKYQEAFSEMLTHTSTDYAPWHVIPADHKWFSHISTFSVILQAMKELAPAYPELDEKDEANLGTIKAELMSGE
jgi:PPK2 family polyphosphate:nucleotide phosphotransferase